MVITCNIRTGRFQAVMSFLRRSISQYRRGSSQFKIGITNSPRRRAIEYGWEFDEMVVLYKTSSSDFARDTEAILVDEYWEDCDNEIGGGGGPLGQAPYYLYIVRKE